MSLGDACRLINAYLMKQAHNYRKRRQVSAVCMREKVAKKRAECYNRYMRFTELKSSLSSDPPSFGYYLTGDDEYVRSRAVDIITGGAAFPEFNVTTLDEPSSGAVLDELNAMPVMSDRRYVVVRVLSEAEELSGYDSSPSPTSVLVVCGRAKGKRGDKKDARLTAFLSSLTEVDCSPVDKTFVFRWMAAEGKKYGAAVTAEAAELLWQYCRGYMTSISVETDKLCSYRSGGTVTADDVRALVTPASEYAVWQLASAAASGDTEKAFAVLRSMDASARSPEMLFSLLYRHFRRMFYALVTPDESTLARELDMNARSVFAVKREASRFGAVKLKEILLRLSRIDGDIKSGALSRDAAAEVLISAAAGGKTARW